MTHTPSTRLLAASQALHLLLPAVSLLLISRHSNEPALHGHSWLLNFDGVHYFSNRYQFEQNHAFLPFFVGILRLLQEAIGEQAALLLLLLLNRVLFCCAAREISTVLDLLGGRQVAKLGTAIFLFNPASIFYHAAYTESLFCFLTCRAIRLSLQLKSEWESAALLGLGVSLRTNGMFLAPVVGLEIIAKFVESARTAKTENAFQLLGKGSVMLVMIVFPFLLHLAFSYASICLWSDLPPLVCSQALPNLYAYVQEKYWEVGLFKYFRIGNWLFILLGSPAVLGGLAGVRLWRREWDWRRQGVFWSFQLLLATTLLFTNIQSSTRFFSTHPYFYFTLATLARTNRIIRCWILAYCISGTVFFPLGFPWT